MRVAYPGTFNPWHKGHQYVYDELCTMFGKDNVFVVIASNPKKKPPREQLKRSYYMVSKAVGSFKNVFITDKTVAVACKDNNIDIVARGMRSGVDASSEFTMADWNLDFGLKTMFIYCGAGLKKMSSSAIRELDSFGVDVTKYLPEGVHDIWKSDGPFFSP